MRKCMICGLYQIFNLTDFLEFSHPNVQMYLGYNVRHIRQNPIGRFTRCILYQIKGDEIYDRVTNAFRILNARHESQKQVWKPYAKMGS